MDYNPTFIKQDPLTGLTFYDFNGHVHADGVDIVGRSGEDADPPGFTPAAGVNWLPTDDTDSSNALAYISGQSTRVPVHAPTPAFEHYQLDLAARSPSSAVSDVDADDTWPAAIHLWSRRYSNATQEAKVSVIAGASAHTLLDGYDRSDFALMRSPATPTLLAPWEPWGGDYACTYQVVGKTVVMNALVSAVGATSGQWIAYNLPAPTNQEWSVYNCLAFSGFSQRTVRVDVRYDSTWHGVITYYDASLDIEWLALTFVYLID